MQKTNKIELLAPAGGQDQFYTAINFGADALYLATKKFGMRAKAANFTFDQLNQLVPYAHSKKVKIYVTCNVLMFDSDIENLPEYFSNLQDIGVDAFIIGDLGAAQIAKKHAPNVAIHVSTQASIANAQAAKTWADFGAKRIVLAREMSLEQIENMRKNLDKMGYADNPENPKSLQLEAFVHGAMCMSVSGRCLISSYLTGRSANKGLCTQPCRWGYNLEEENRKGQKFQIVEDNYATYIMNSKDLNMLNNIDKLKQAGISSLKIEGRNKKSLYVATVVNAYRHVIDFIETNNNYSDEEYNDLLHMWQKELENVSHRPYSTGFYFGEAQQAIDYDGYEQNCVHVADVLDCEKTCNGNYKIHVLCRNRFENNQILEALIPNKNITETKIENLHHLNTETNYEKSIDVANIAKDHYIITSKIKIPKNSFLRARTFLRTTRKNI